MIYKSFIYCFTHDSFNKSIPKTTIIELELFVKNLELNHEVFDNIYNFLLSKSNSNENYRIAIVNDILLNIDKMLSEIKLTLSVIPLFGQYTYKLSLKGNVWGFFGKLINIGFTQRDSLISYSWGRLSAGEEALLTQFSEFYQVFKNRYFRKKFVLVNIDEGELYLHPEWQRIYIDSMIHFFDYFKGEFDLSTNFQFIITSHSPFIAADIPKYNLIFLDRNKEDGNTVVVNPVTKHATFGGNIFDLFSDSFFVEEFISAFAYNRIDQAFKFLKGEESVFKDINDVIKFSKIIGETLIRDEIQKLIMRKTDSQFWDENEIYSGGKIKVSDKPKRKK